MKSTKSLDQRRKENSERNVTRAPVRRGGDQGILKDQRGQEQPTDTKRARDNR